MDDSHYVDIQTALQKPTMRFVGKVIRSKRRVFRRDNRISATNAAVSQQ